MHGVVGGNFRLDALQAALLAVKLPHLPEYTAHRQRHASEYTLALAGMAAGAAIAISLPVTHPDRTHIANQYTIRVRRGPAWRHRESPRDALRRRLANAGLLPRSITRFRCTRRNASASSTPSGLPVAEEAAGDILSLPVFPELTAEETASVAAEIRQFASEANG